MDTVTECVFPSGWGTPPGAFCFLDECCAKYCLNIQYAQASTREFAHMSDDGRKVPRKSSDEDSRTQALAAVLAQIERQFGKGSIMRLGDKEQVAIPAIPTGSLGLGIGGLPKGRVVEIYGPESSGKTTLTLQVIAEAQKLGGACAFIDAEHALDPIYAQALGVDTDELLVSQPDTGEEALEICEMVPRSRAKWATRTSVCRRG